MTTTLCAMCSKEAVANLHGRWLCAQCGLHQTTVAAGLERPSPSYSRPRRRTIVAAFGTGLAAKILIGAAALAAVGGVIVADPHLAGGDPAQPTEASSPPTSAAVTTTGPPTSVNTPDTAAIGAAEGPEPGLPPSVNEFVIVLDQWAECIADTARTFASARPEPGQGFDPSACGPRPEAPVPDHARTQQDPGPPEWAGQPQDPGPRERGPQGARGNDKPQDE